MSTTDNELTALVAQLLQLQQKAAELEAQQSALRQEIATSIAKADDLRRKRTRGKDKGTDTAPE
jgi:prefoldin subunit 5